MYAPMEHAHPSYASIIFQMSFTDWVKFEQKFYTQILLRSPLIIILWVEPTKKDKVQIDVFLH
jgi:hypothetical protein